MALHKPKPVPQPPQGELTPDQQEIKQRLRDQQDASEYGLSEREIHRRFSKTRFELGEIYTVSFNSPGPDMEYMIDGYPVRGSYSGKYFAGQRIEIKDHSGSAAHNWAVNSESNGNDVLDISVESDLIIEIIP